MATHNRSASADDTLIVLGSAAIVALVYILAKVLF
jgi:hypothetical protein